MGKSIRSKIKRKHRAEFRSTVGAAAYEASMAKVQEKLKACIEKQSLKSLDRLSEALDTSTTVDASDSNAVAMEETDVKPSFLSPGIDASETKGENKVLVSKRSKRKLRHSYKMKAIERKRSAETAKPKPKPRFHCAF